MLYPLLDICLTSKPIAEIIKPDGTVSEYPITAIAGKYFIVKFNKATGAVFEIDHSKAVLWREELFGMAFSHTKYYYDARNIKPIDPKIMKEIDVFREKNNINRITRQNQKDSKYLRDKLKLTENLTQFKNLDKDVAFEAKLKNLEKAMLLEIQHPMSMAMSESLDEFKAVEPEYIFNFMSALHSVDLEHKKLQSKPVKGGMQIGIFLMIAIIGMVVAMFLPNVIQNWSNIQIPNLGGILPSIPTGPTGHFLMGLHYHIFSFFN